MKIDKIIFTILACVVMTACGDRLADLNIDPNVSLAGGNGRETLTAGQGYYGIALEAYFNEYDALLAQYWAGGPGVALIDLERYFIEAADYNTEWAYSYADALSNLSYTIANGNKVLAGVANIYSVLIYQNLVDHYGNIPYSEALNGVSGNLTPVYDDAKMIYDDLIVRLDAAITTLSDPNLAVTVGAEDLVYGGDLTKWIAFANSLKLRILMRQSITDPSVGTQVIDLISSGTFIDDVSTLAKLPFAGAATANFNPQYARREAGVKQFYIASNASANLLNSLNDPRALVIYDEAVNAANTLVGVDQGNVQDIGTVAKADFSYPSAVAYGESNDVILMSHWEVMFLRAEADMRFGTADDEKAMYDAAVTAHFSYVGATIGNYLSTPNVMYEASATVSERSNLIGTQKWISMNGLQEAEGWIESRRFDNAASGNIFTKGIFQTPTRSVFPSGVFPSKRLYPQSEVDYNKSNVPQGSTVLNKVFWDN